MNALDEATKFLNDKNCVWDQPTLRKVIAGLVQMLICERKEHAAEIRSIVTRSNQGE